MEAEAATNRAATAVKNAALGLPSSASGSGAVSLTEAEKETMSIIGSAAELSGLEPDDVLDIGLGPNPSRIPYFDGDFGRWKQRIYWSSFGKKITNGRLTLQQQRRSQIHLGVEHVRRGVLYHLQIHLSDSQRKEERPSTS